MTSIDSTSAISLPPKQETLVIYNRVLETLHRLSTVQQPHDAALLLEHAEIQLRSWKFEFKQKYSEPGSVPPHVDDRFLACLHAIEAILERAEPE